MLKKFIQLFAEKFLISKRGWVSTQRNIDSSKTVELSLPNNTELHSYLPPSNGMLVLGQSNSSGYAYLEVTASGAKFNLDQIKQTDIIKPFRFLLIRESLLHIKLQQIIEVSLLYYTLSRLLVNPRCKLGGMSC